MPEASRQPATGRRLAVLLGVLAALLAGLIVLRLWAIDQGPALSPVAPTTEAPAETGTAFPAVPAAPPLAEFSAMVERPLFHPDRRPQEAPAEPAAPDAPAAEPLPNVVLTGVVIAGGERAVLVQEAGAERPQRLTVGDAIQGWTVDRIENDAVRFRRNGRTMTLQLRQYEAPGTPAAEPEAPRRDRPM